MITIFMCGMAIGTWIMWAICIGAVNKYKRLCEKMINLNKEMHATNCNMLIDMVNYSPNAIEDPIVKLN